MEIIDYKFRKFTKKDMFEVKLKDVRPRFEYISCNKERQFHQFCVDMGFIEFAGKTQQKGRYAYKILVPFAYHTMIDYRARSQDCNKNCHVFANGMLNHRRVRNA